MMIQEFEALTGFYPTQDLYYTIEDAYIESDLDKYAFCKAYKNNENGMAEAITRRTSAARIAADDKAQKDIAKRISTLEAKVELLKTQLDREQEWRPYDDTQNVSQADYETLAKGAENRIRSHYMTDEEAIQWICDEFDFDPAKVTILHEIDEYEVNRHNQLRKTGRKIDRRPVYCATDYHYIRFNTRCRYYECWNGELRPFFD